jgi:hypothetical protein
LNIGARGQLASQAFLTQVEQYWGGYEDGRAGGQHQAE